MRIYNPSLGRFLSTDPITKEYPELTPYQFASNTPIWGIDLDGLEVYYATDGTRLGQIGTSTQVRKVEAADIKTVSYWIDRANNSPGKLSPESIVTYIERYSADVGMTEEELNVRATLGTLKQTEAGRSNAPLDYNTWNKGDNFTEESYEDKPEGYLKHPGKNTNVDSKTKKEKGGTAAGAYQFLERFYTGNDFSPQSQDQAAVDLMSDKQLAAAKSGDVAQVKKTMSGKWTSLQHWSPKNLQAEFTKHIVEELNGNSKIATPKGDLQINR
jgi:muramidase (phage lysozyme)